MNDRFWSSDFKVNRIGRAAASYSHRQYSGAGATRHGGARAPPPLWEMAGHRGHKKGRGPYMVKGQES